MGFRTPNFQQFQQPQQQKQFQDQDQDLQPMGKRQKGTGFTNIGRILGANVGAGERMGRQVGQAVGMQAGQARAGVTQAEQKFKTAKTEAEQRADLAQQGIKNVLDDASGLAGLTEEQAKERRERFLKEGQYTGPKGLEQEAQLKARAEALGDVATMGMSGREGRRQLARSIVAGPGMYTRGQSLLDATLLGQSAAAQRAIEAGSRQALGAQREIAETIGSTREQAKAAESALSKEKQAIGTKLAEKLTGVEEAGGAAAKQFADDINRFNQLTTAKKSVDKDGNVTYEDTSGKKLEITDRDRELVSNPQQFGLNASDIDIDLGREDLSRGILAQIAGKGAYTYQKGAKRYTPEQEAIARNLALFKGETPSEYSPFETDIFKLSGKNIAKESESYRGQQQARQTEINNIADLVNKQFTSSLVDPSKDILSQIESIKNQTMRNINEAELSQKQSGDTGYNQALDNYYSLLNNLNSAENQYKNLMQSRKTTSLEDYLKNLYGVKPSNVVRDVPIQSGPRVI